MLVGILWDRHMDHVGGPERDQDHDAELGGVPPVPVNLAPATQDFMSLQHVYLPQPACNGQAYLTPSWIL